MKKKLFKFFTAVSVLGATATLASCGGGESTTTPTAPTGTNTTVTSKPEETKVSEIYYCSAPEGDYLFTKTGSNFTLSLLGKTYSGTYTLVDNSYTLSATGLAECSAEMIDDVLVVRLSGKTYSFYKVEPSTVTFNVDGEETTVSAMNGKRVAKPEVPVKEGYTFIGWYKDSSYNEVYNFDVEVVKGDLTLYARFVETTTETEYTVSFKDGDTTLFVDTKTTNGAVYDLPTPEDKDGKKFLGWWTSDFNDPEKLTSEYKGETLTSNTVLYAVWDDGSLHVSVTASGVTWNSLGTGAAYTVDIEGPAGKKSFPSNTVSYKYNFNSEVAGTYKVTVTSGDKATTVYYNNKTLARVSSFEVVDSSVLVFEPVRNAEGYKITVECGDSDHKHRNYDLKGNTYFDFSNCSMKKGGIVFTVVAYAEGYQESLGATYVYEKTLDKVSGLSVESDTVSWNRVSNATAYVVEVTSNGKVDTYNVGNTTAFDLKGYTGELKVSVYPVSKGYNSPEPATTTVTKTTLASPTNVKVVDGVVTWDAVEGATGYTVLVDDEAYEVTEASYKLVTTDFEKNSAHSVYVMATNADSSKSSAYSDVYTFTYLGLTSVSYSNGVVSWDSVVGAKKYGVVVNDGSEVVVKGESKLEVAFDKAGLNTIKVCFYDKNNVKSAYVEVEVYTFAVYYDSCTEDGTVVPTGYYAYGDTVVFPTVSFGGYNFAGWYNLPDGPKNNASKFEEGSMMPSTTVVLFAYWTPQDYDVVLDCGEDAEVETTSAVVTYKEGFVLPVATRDSVDIMFDGWYTEKGGKGTKITDANGNSVNPWAYRSGMTLYAKWVNVLSYEAVKDNSDSVIGYRAVAGEGIKYASEITVPATYNNLPVLELGNFTGSAKLTKLNLPDTLNYVDTVTGFTGCNSLEAVNVYEVDQSSYKHEVLYASKDGVLYYNNTINELAGWEVKFVPLAKTGNCNIMEGTVSIPIKAFYWTAITSVTIPYTVAEIGTQAFYYSDITSVTFEETPEGVDEVALTLGDRCFASCYDLTTITLPKRLQTITMGFSDYNNLNSFAYCSYLEEINVEDGCKAYKSVEGVVYNKLGTELITCPAGRSGEFVIPAAVTTVKEFAFRSCSKITKLTVPASVAEIGVSAFEYCYDLEEVVFEEADNPEIADLTIKTKAFYSDDLLELTFPKHLRTIESYAFGGNSRLKTVTVNSEGELSFGTGVTSDESSYGYSYSYVTTVNLSDTASLFDVAGVFNGSNNKLATINVSANNQYYYMNPNDGVLYNKEVTKILYYPLNKKGDFTLPETVTEISANVFTGRDFVTFTVGKNVEFIGENAFGKCLSLKEVVFEEGREKDLVIDKLAFNDCSVLEKVHFPEKTVSIGDKVFYDCTSLYDVVLPSTLTTIGSEVFYYCDALKSVTLPKSLENIGSYAGIGSEFNLFAYCHNLENVNVAEGNNKFASVDGIVYEKTNNVIKTLCYSPMGKKGEVVIPNTVNYIANEAFYYNEFVTSITFEEGKSAVNVEGVEETLSLGENIFYMCERVETVSLPNITVVPSSIFQNCYSLKTFEVPYKVTSIENEAFYGCRGLESVTFEATPEGVEELPFSIKNATGTWYAPFAYSGLKSITLPERTVEIGDYALAGCTYLNSVNVPDKVTALGKYAFYQSTALKTVTISENSKLTEINNYAFAYTSLAEINIPDNVTLIGLNAFTNTKITSFKWPKAIDTIPANCFFGCTNLETFDFGESTVTAISDYAFSGCTSLSSFTIPDSVKSLGNGAFANCDHIANFNFGANSKLSTIGDNCFIGTGITEFAFPVVHDDSGNVIPFATLGSSLLSGCDKLETVTISESVESVTGVFKGAKFNNVVISENNKEFSVEEGSPVLYNSDKTAIRYVYGASLTGEYRIPDTVKAISDYAFESQPNVTKVYIPSSVVSVGDGVFINCSSLTSVEFESGSGVTSIGYEMFSGCAKLLNVKLPEDLDEIPEKAFFNCKSLLSVNAPKAKSIGISAFQGCSSIKTVDFSKQATFIGQYSFSDCTSLESVYIPKTATFGDNAFSNCSKLSSVTLEEGIETLPYYFFSKCKSLSSIVLPSTLTTIDSYCFNESGLVTLELPESLTSIYYNSFSDCTLLESVKFNCPLLTELDDYAFSNCTSLASVELPENLEFLGYGVFQNCTALTSITLPDSLKAIGVHTFRNSGLKSLTIPLNVEKIGVYSLTSTISDYTTSYLVDSCPDLEEVKIESSKLEVITAYSFSNCPKLKSIEIPSSVTTIAQYSFYNSGIETIEIPLTVTSIGNNAFANCKNLNSITLPSMLETIDENTFAGCSSLTSIELPETVTTIKKSAFAGSGIENINLNNVGTFGSDVFSDCKALTAVEISSTATSLSDNLFFGCTSLDTVILNEGLASIGNSTFEGCSSLTSISLPSSVNSIGNLAFAKSGLTGEFVIGESVTSLGYNPFMSCNNLEIKLNNNTEFVFKEGSLFTSDNTLVLLNPSFVGEYVVTSDMSVNGYAFAGVTGLTKITLAEGVSSLAPYEFGGTINVEEIVLPSTVTKIPSYAFSGATLDSFTLPETVTSMEEYAFAKCDIKSVAISKLLKEIPSNAFAGSLGLEEINFYGDVSNLATIGDYAFEDCESLAKINLPETITKFGESTFKNTGFVEFTIPANAELGYSMFNYCKKLTTVTYAEGVTHSGNYTFGYCEALTTVNFSSTITELGYGLFNYCTALKTLRLPENLVQTTECFDYSGLETVIIPAGVKTIGSYTFWSCESLSNVIFEGEIEEISYGAFNGCTKIEKLVIPSSNLKLIASAVFSGWTEDQTICFTTSQGHISSISDLSSGGTFSQCSANIIYDYVIE